MCAVPAIQGTHKIIFYVCSARCIMQSFSDNFLLHFFQVTFHTQLCWVLASLTTMAKLGQQAQLREKRKVVHELSTALYLYPVLQAADILLYR